MMITGLLLSAIVPFLITKIGGMLISNLLLKLGASQAVARTSAAAVGEIAKKLAAGKLLDETEQATWKTHVTQHYAKPAGSASEVASSPGVPFHRT